MPDVLVAATVLSLLFAVLMTVIAARLLRESRTHTSARVEALQAIAGSQVVTASGSQVPINDEDEEPLAPTVEPRHVSARAPEHLSTRGPENLSTREPDDLMDDWDFALRDEPTLPVGAPVQRAQPRFEPPPARIEPVGVSDHDLFAAAIPPTPSRRWTWVAAVALVMALGSGTFYLISSGVITRAIATHDANAANAATLPIELLSLRYATDAGNFVVTGLVQNPAASVSLHGVQAVVYLFDADGKFIASAHASIENGVLSPGGESSFVVRVPTGSEVTKYRVSFQHEDGAAVQHVDRRGALPANTTGDAVQPPPAATPVVTARKNG